MSAVRSALIVGGGIGGMSAALVLRRLGIAVDLIDLDPAWRVYGAGITITSPTLRAFEQLGVLDDILHHGFSGHGIQVCTTQGKPVDEIMDPPGMPGSGGIMRPTLHAILSRRTRDSGTDIRLGITVDALVERDGAVDVQFSDGSAGRYDLVLGADGLFSRVRTLIMPDAPVPEYTGQTVWRLFTDRPPSIDRRHFYLGGKAKVGICPVSADSVYLFLLEARDRPPIVPDEQLHGMLRDLLSEYGGVVGGIRDTLSADSPIVMRPLEAFLLPAPWNVGRTLLVGDAAHPTTPQLASGAGMAVEDAIVLGEELTRGGSVEDVLGRYNSRRADRCRLVVENSLEIGRLERERAAPAVQTRVVAETLRLLAEPI